MKIKKHVNDNDLIEFFYQIHSKIRSKIIKYINENNDIYLIMENNFYLGFVHLKFFSNKILTKLYLSPNWKSEFNEQLFENISILIKDFNQDYITIVHCFDSKNILNKINGIDFMYQYECKANSHKPDPELNSNFTMLKSISNYKDLIDFHYLCYADDKDYMNGNWDKMLQSFSKVPIPKITYICFHKDKIVGSCIGYFIHKKNKKYLYSICVHPDHRSKSISEYLLQSFLKTKPLTSCYLTVYESAKPAINLYEKFGFKRKKQLKQYYKNDDKIKRIFFRETSESELYCSFC